MKISMIAALDERRGIGRGGELPWRLSTDLRRFKRLTMGHHIIMGRKTYQSMGKPLPGRVNIVVTRQKSYQPDGMIVTHSFQEALDIAEQGGDSEVFIIGGGELFTQALPISNQLYLTIVHTDSHADIFFPEIGDEWSIVYTSEFPASNNDEFSTTFVIYKRV